MMYIYFSHGRDTIEEELIDQGYSGPIVEIEDLKWVYGNIHLFDEGKMYTLTTIKEEGLIPIEGKFYSDFDLMREEEDFIQGIKRGSFPNKLLFLEEFIELNKYEYKKPGR